MAGIIAGRDSAVSAVNSATPPTSWAWHRRAIVSIKVADALGKTDVSQVLAAHRLGRADTTTTTASTSGVLNLSFGTDSNQSYALDPLAYAAEQAWKQRIVVVVAAGNRQPSDGLDDPAIDPYVIAVGAADTMGTTYATPLTRTASRARATARAIPTSPPPASTSCRCVIRVRSSTTRSAPPRRRAAGSSSAAARRRLPPIVSGAAALLLSQRPGLTPDQVKALLAGNTHYMQGSILLKGSGELNLSYLLDARRRTPRRTSPPGRVGLAAGRRGAAAPRGPEPRGRVPRRPGLPGPAPPGRALRGRAPRGRGPRGPGLRGPDPAGLETSGARCSGAAARPSPPRLVRSLGPGSIALLPLGNRAGTASSD